jgi:hypothetical protein
MAGRITVVRNDTSPPIACQLYDSVTGTLIDLTPPTRVVKAKFRKAGTTTVLFTTTCSKVPGGEEAGQVLMYWPANSLDDIVGNYELEWSVEDDGGLIQTVPTPTKIRVKADF